MELQVHTSTLNRCKTPCFYDICAHMRNSAPKSAHLRTQHMSTLKIRTDPRNAAHWPDHDPSHLGVGSVSLT